MMCFPVGYIYFDSVSKLRSLNKSVLYLIIFSVFSSALGYIFGIGRIFEYDVSEEQTIGILGSSGLYSAALAVGILPLLLSTTTRRFWRWILFSSSLVVYVFILLNVRRTAIFIPVLGLLTYAWFTPNKSKILSGIIVGIVVLLLASPLYYDKLMSRYSVRADAGRFDEDFYKTENRYIENVNVFTEVFSFDNPVKSFFGEKIYASGRFDDKKTRMNHSDPANLLAGTGIIGVILYIMVYIGFFKFPRFCKNKFSSQMQLYKTTYYSLLFMSLFVALNGSLMLVSLRSILFLYLGAMLSLMCHESHNNEYV